MGILTVLEDVIRLQGNQGGLSVVWLITGWLNFSDLS